MRPPCKKICFRTEQQAQQFNKGMQTYFCDACKAWHLTSGVIGKIHKDLKNGTFEIRHSAWAEWNDRKNRNRRRRR